MAMYTRLDPCLLFILDSLVRVILEIFLDFSHHIFILSRVYQFKQRCVQKSISIISRGVKIDAEVIFG